MAHDLVAKPLRQAWWMMRYAGKTHDRIEIHARAKSYRHRSPLCATGMRMTEQRASSRACWRRPPIIRRRGIVRRCVAVDDKISISTVYRTVKLFEDAGIIERHDFREGAPLRADARQPPRSTDQSARRPQVIEFTSEEIDKLQAEIAASSVTS